MADFDNERGSENGRFEGCAVAAFENLALRQQLAVCRQSIKRPKLRLYISLPGRFVATGLGVTVEQPESRGTL